MGLPTSYRPPSNCGTRRGLEVQHRLHDGLGDRSGGRASRRFTAGLAAVLDDDRDRDLGRTRRREAGEPRVRRGALHAGRRRSCPPPGRRESGPGCRSLGGDIGHHLGALLGRPRRDRVPEIVLLRSSIVWRSLLTIALDEWGVMTFPRLPIAAAAIAWSRVALTSCTDRSPTAPSAAHLSLRRNRAQGRPASDVQRLPSRISPPVPQLVIESHPSRANAVLHEIVSAWSSVVLAFGPHGWWS